MRKIYLLIVFVITFGCNKTEYKFLIEEPVPKPSVEPPKSFAITIKKTADSYIDIEWERIQEHLDTEVNYDIALNDSVVAYDLQVNTYRIDNLRPNTTYNISVLAIDVERNQTKVDTVCMTKKSLVEQILKLEIDLEQFHIFKSIETKDRGLLLSGTIAKNDNQEYIGDFVLKLDNQFKTEFLFVFNSKEVIADIKELNDGYLIVRNHSVTKLSVAGKVIWTYNESKLNIVLDLKCAIQDQFNNCLISGSLIDNSQSEAVLQYFILKLTSTGEKVWQTTGGTTKSYRPQDMIITNEEVLIFGSVTMEKSVVSNWILSVDQQGNVEKEYIYPNMYSVDDLPNTLIQTSDQGYLLIGTAVGVLPQKGYYSYVPRFLKLNSEKEIEWDNYFEMETVGMSTSVTIAKQLEDDKLMVLTNYRYISTINSYGEFIKSITLHDFPNCVFIRNGGNEILQCITQNGYVIVLNQDGFIE